MPDFDELLASRAGFVALAAELYLVAGLLATWPAVKHLGTHFLAERASSVAEAAPGDHLQTGWNLWLFGHQLEHANAFWHDPYSFRPELSPRVNFQGLVFGLPYWPLFALFGAVLAWNLFTLLTFVGAGGATCAWLRALGLPRGAALVGGLAFALAPYRVAQSTGHLLGPISLFLPLSLLALEKRRPFLAGAAIAAIPLSGQVSLAVGAVPFFVAYAFVRGRGWCDAVPGDGVRRRGGRARAVLRDSRLAARARAVARGGRPLLGGLDRIRLAPRKRRDVRFPRLADAAARARRPGAALSRPPLRPRHPASPPAVVVPVVIALGTHLPTYSLARHLVPGLKVARVPERLLPLACLALAALVAFALARARPWLVVVALVLVAADLHVRIYHAARADEGNAAYVARRGSGARGACSSCPSSCPTCS